jgi:hypothetical protein
MRCSIIHAAALARAVALVCAAGIAALPASPLLAQGSQPEAMAALRAAVDSEMQASQTDKSNWMYRDEDDTPERKALYNTVETPQGSLRRLIAIDGHPLSPGAQLDELTRIQAYIHDSAAQNHARRNGQHDDAQAAELLRMLPDAFLWNISSQNAETITLDFKPNPAFVPPDTQSRVLGAMGGQLVIARDGNRIRSLHGRLLKEIVFGLAIFGKLDPGGTFDVERRVVGDGRWQITETHVHIGGRALFFKTIGTQEDEVKTNWRPSTDATLAAAAHTLGAN